MGGHPHGFYIRRMQRLLLGLVEIAERADEIPAILGLCETLTIEGAINCSLNISDCSYILGA